MGTVWKMKSWRGVQSVRKTGNGSGRVAGERGYGVMFSPYGSMVLDPSTLSLLQAPSIFNTFYWLHFDIRGGVVLLLKLSVKSCLDPVGRSSAGYLSHNCGY